MNIKNGFITINHKKYKYKIFNTDGLIDLIQHNKKFIESLQYSIQLLREDPKFHISELLNEHTENVIYFIVYKKDIVSTLRLYHNLEKKSGYIDLVYTNPDYRGQKICQTNIAYMIRLTKKYIKKYELHVDVHNIPALKCYENNGFKIKIKSKGEYLMRLTNSN